MTFNTYTVEVAPEIEDSMYEVAQQYEDFRKGLGGAFLIQVEAFYTTLKRNPYSYSFHQNSPPLREGQIKQFPYVILFVIVEATVVIHQIFDSRKDPLKKIIYD